MGPRQDGGVVRRPARLHDDPPDLGPVELRGIGRAQVVGGDHVPAFPALEGRAGGATQILEQPSPDVRDVALPLPQVLVGEPVENSLEFPQNGPHRPFGIHAVGPDHFLHPVNQQGIGEHEALRLEEIGPVLAQCAPGGFADLAELFRRPVAGVREPADFEPDLPLADFHPEHGDGAPFEDDGGRYRDPGRRRFTTQDGLFRGGSPGVNPGGSHHRGPSLEWAPAFSRRGMSPIPSLTSRVSASSAGSASRPEV